MIIGIGTDITDISRFEHNIEQHGDRFVGKILSDLEKPRYEASNQKAQYLASRFAAKEALVKALGTGFKDGIIMPDIAILSNDLGRPYFELSGSVKAHAEALNVQTLHLSISHEKQFALAFVILS
jgi:holo-[acyl-carrier protein] synthase